MTRKKRIVLKKKKPEAERGTLSCCIFVVVNVYVSYLASGVNTERQSHKASAVQSSLAAHEHHLSVMSGRPSTR